MLRFSKSSIDHVLPVPSRCLFCLSKVALFEGAPNFESLPSYWDKLPADKFQNVWKHLTIHDSTEDGERFTFPETPPLCSTCGGWLEKISSALEQLSNATNVIRKIVTSCGKNGVHSGRLLELLEEMKIAKVFTETWVEALHLLETIGHEPFQENDLPDTLSSIDKEQESAGTKEEPEVKQESEESGSALDDCDNLSESDGWNWNEKLAPSGNPVEDDAGRDSSEERMDDETLVPTPTRSPGMPLEDEDPLGDNAGSDEDFRPGSDSDEDEDSLSDESTEETLAIPTKSNSKRQRLRRDHINDKLRKKPLPARPAYMKPCDFCGDFLHLDNMLEHVRGHVGDYVLPCPNPNCRYAFACSPAWKRHLHYTACKKFPRKDPLQCELCEYRGINIVHLLSHLTNTHETSTKPFPCPVSGCSERFSVRQSVANHIYTHAISISELPTTTPLCSRADRFSSHICDFCREEVSLDKLLEHIRGHVGDYALPCPNPDCSLVFSTPSSLRRHHKSRIGCRKYMTSNSAVCEICGESFASPFNLLNHLKPVHETDEKPYPCPVADCNERFTLRQSVQCHISYHSSSMYGQEVKRSYSCEFCEKIFAKKRMLSIHERSHNASKAKRFSCDMPGCSKRFTTLPGLKMHKDRETHADPENPHKCHHCNESFVILSKLQHHLALKHKEKVKVKKLPTGQKELVEPEKLVSRKRCPDCPDDETLRSYQTMRNHRIAMHGAKPFKCAECGDQFQTSDQFKIHRRTHRAVKEEPKRFVCDVPGCGKGFKSNTDLSIHKSSIEHLGRTNAVVCGQCGKGFNYMARLKAHEKLVHATERKYVCDDCGESFKSGTVLKRHKLIHTGERPFQCDICQQRFRTREVLKKHVESHERKGASFRPNGPMKHVRRRVNPQ